MPATITRVRIDSYKSIAHCDVALGPLTYLVGPNGAGKSNFIDALWFLGTALWHSPQRAVEARGSFGDLVHRGATHPEVNLGIDLSLDNSRTALYALSLRSDVDGAVRVHREHVEVEGGDTLTYFSVKDGQVSSASFSNLWVQPDRLTLSAYGNHEHLRDVYEALTNATFYDIVPDRLREPRKRGNGKFLYHSGENLVNVLHRLHETDRRALARIETYLAAIVPECRGVTTTPLNDYVLLQIKQTKGDFAAGVLSNGTLRALGILTALFQTGIDIPLVAIEEPEAALHPAALAVLRDALSEASERRQVLVTTHSPEVLDAPDVPAEAIRVVRYQNGETQIGPIDDASKQVLHDGLFTAGKLLRMNQLTLEKAS